MTHPQNTRGLANFRVWSRTGGGTLRWSEYLEDAEARVHLMMASCGAFQHLHPGQDQVNSS